ncbi:lysophospholipase catalytic domain-containing protein [Mycena capillaripes]|nr:lysophospholipase catalytic domain-containing protein [Mycena capillaripes]
MKSFIASLLITGAFSSLPLLVVSQLPPFSKTSLAAYTPQIGPCSPNFSLVREATPHWTHSLSAGEQAYTDARRKDVLPDAFRSYVKNLISTGQDIPPTLKSIFYGERGASPNYGMALSGGAFRAGLFEAGAINVFDGRNTTSNFAGFGGILQGAQYMAGLSGGGWFVTGFAQANMPSIPEFVFGRPDAKDDEYGGFNIAFDVLTPFSNNTLNQGFIGGLILETSGKSVGNPVTLSDAFGISLARHFANGTHADNLLDFDAALHGTGQLFSDIAKVPAFQTHNLPFPIILSTLNSNNGNPNDTIPGEIIPLSNTKFEYNIFEFGSYDPSLGAFIPMQSLGTVNESSCVVGFDQIAFVLGSTGDVFPQVNASASFTPNDPLVLEFEASTAAFQQLIPKNQANIRLDSALIPNAFAGRHGFTEENEEFLTLSDGGIDGANLPLQPLLVAARGLQAIIALDVSGNTDDNFADGSAMIAEAKRVALFSGAYKFPQIPQTQAEFVAQNLTTQPTFFGCDEDQDVPMIVYLANGAPPPGKPPITNASTGQLSFPDLGLVQAIIDQAGEIVSRGRPQNGEARDGLFPVCVACALADRERSRLGMKRDRQCDVCFDRYCYKPGKGSYQQGSYAASASGALHAALAAADSGSSSSSSDGLTKYGPIAIGLLGANLLVSIVLLVLGLVLCLRRRGARTRYTPLNS